MSRSKKRYLVDINVWLALAYQLHLHHEIALAWFDTLGANTAFACRVSQLGLLRLLTNPAVMREQVQSRDAAWITWEQITADERVGFSDEPQGVEISFRRLSKGRQAGHQRWMDAYLAAFAESGGLELVTFDRGFGAWTEQPITLLGVAS